METDPRGSVLCNITRVETNKLGSSQHPECNPQPPAQTGQDHPGGCSNGLACWKRKSDTRNEITDPSGTGSGGVHPVWLWPKSERELQSGGLPGPPHSWDLQRDPRQLPAPGAGGGTGSGKWLWQIHTCFPFFIHINHRNPLHKAQFQLPISRSGAARPFPGGHRPELLTQIQHHREHLFFLFCLFFLPPFSPQKKGTTLGIHPTCRSVS